MLGLYACEIRTVTYWQYHPRTLHLVSPFPPGIDANIKDSLGRTVLDILKEHPSQKSLQIATLLQGKQC